jgi:hypothetical protein
MELCKKNNVHRPVSWISAKKFDLSLISYLFQFLPLILSTKSISLLSRFLVNNPVCLSSLLCQFFSFNNSITLLARFPAKNSDILCFNFEI